MAVVHWPESVLEVLSELPERERDVILEKVTLLERFPRMFPVRMKGRFRNHRWILARNWIVFYRVSEETVYVRGLWPARIPSRGVQQSAAEVSDTRTGKSMRSSVLAVPRQ